MNSDAFRKSIAMLDKKTLAELEPWLVPSQSRVTTPYRSVWGKREWDAHSWIRSKPWRGLTLEPSKLFYLPAATPVLNHPTLVGVSDLIRARILTHQLLRVLYFTDWVELDLVNPATRLLTLPSFLPFLPNDLRRDAYLIYADEIGHSAFSKALKDAIEVATGVRAVGDLPHTAAIHELSVAALPKGFGPLGQLAWVVTSESLITASLTTVASNPDVQPSIRDVLKDHAADETRHRNFFGKVFRAIWPNLTEEGRRVFATELAKALDAYLGVDVAWLTLVLEDVLFPTEAARAIAAETASLPSTRAGIREAAKPVIELLEEFKAFQDDIVAEAFRIRDLR